MFCYLFLYEKCLTNKCTFVMFNSFESWFLAISNGGLLKVLAIVLWKTSYQDGPSEILCKKIKVTYSTILCELGNSCLISPDCWASSVISVFHQIVDFEHSTAKTAAGYILPTYKQTFEFHFAAERSWSTQQQQAVWCIVSIKYYHSLWPILISIQTIPK